MLAHWMRSVSSKNYFYFPAAKSALMKTYQTVFDSLLTRQTGNLDFNVPALDGVTADYLRSCINLTAVSRPPSHWIIEHFNPEPQKRKTKFYNVFTKLGEEILGGRVYLDKVSGSQRTRQIMLEQGSLNLTINLWSSSVTELAMFGLFLQKYIKAGDLILIEEPESHLHPEAQRKICNILVDLVSSGVRVIATPHSPIILEQLSNAVSASKLKVTKRKTYVKEHDVGVYQFQWNKGLQGTVVEKLEFDRLTGSYPVTAFDKVFDEQLEEGSQIIRQWLNQ